VITWDARAHIIVSNKYTPSPSSFTAHRQIIILFIIIIIIIVVVVEFIIGQRREENLYSGRVQIKIFEKLNDKFLLLN
jgi:hypothetical protein